MVGPWYGHGVRNEYNIEHSSAALGEMRVNNPSAESGNGSDSEPCLYSVNEGNMIPCATIRIEYGRASKP